MPRNDKAIPKKNQKLVFQQANSRCSFCDESNVSLLELHHIVPRAEGGSNDPHNLLLVCKNCHGLIEAGDISLEEVIKKKQSFGAIIHQMPKRDNGKGNNVNISGSVNSSIVANNLTINSGSKSSKKEYPKGSIGANLDKKNYIQHWLKGTMISERLIAVMVLKDLFIIVLYTKISSLNSKLKPTLYRRIDLKILPRT